MIFFFFFQAEDGIRDYKVTGVQTCALPISPAEIRAARRGWDRGPPRCLWRTGAWPRPPSCSRTRSPPEPSRAGRTARPARRSEEHTSELQSPCNLVCRLLLEKKKKKNMTLSRISTEQSQRLLNHTTRV